MCGCFIGRRANDITHNMSNIICMIWVLAWMMSSCVTLISTKHVWWILFPLIIWLNSDWKLDRFFQLLMSVENLTIPWRAADQVCAREIFRVLNVCFQSHTLYSRWQHLAPSLVLPCYLCQVNNQQKETMFWLEHVLNFYQSLEIIQQSYGSTENPQTFI